MTTYAGCDNAMTAYAGCDDAMTTYAGGASIGAEGSYPDVAAKAVQQISAQNPSAFYGYVRSGVHQKIYLFPLRQDATNWFSQHTQLEPAHDYAAVFSSMDLRAPIPGMEHFNTTVSSEQVGNWVLPLLALPLGALAGYYYRNWREKNPGKFIPFIQGDPAVGSWGELAGSQVGGPWHEMIGAAPWLDVQPTVGGPWHEMVGGPWHEMVGAADPQPGVPPALLTSPPALSPHEAAAANAFMQSQTDVIRRNEWPQTRALIQSAIDAVTEAASTTPAAAYVWHLDAPTQSPYAGSTPGSTIMLEPTSLVEAFNTQAQALARLREVALTRPIALAMFERASSHWPNPTAWRKASDPFAASMIAQYIASRPATVSGQWMDLVGAQAQQTDAVRRAEWPQTRALIQSAIDAATEAASTTPAAAYVWHLDAPTQSPYAGRTVVLEPTSLVEAFNTQAQALARLREVALTRPIALAMFERASSHWPNPTAWRKSSDPADAPLIAQYVASRTATQTSGTYMGADPVASTAILAVRQRAQQLADRRAGNVIGVIHTPKDNLWHTLAFRNEDDADDWLDLAAQTPASFTYAAYFNKNSPQWPRAVIEKVSGMRSPPGTGLSRRSSATVGAALDDNRARGKQLASARPGRGAGAIRAGDGLWHVYGFTSLDDAVDWLQSVTREKSKFIYAAAYEKGADGTAFIQDEEFGTAQTARTVAGRAA